MLFLLVRLNGPVFAVLTLQSPRHRSWVSVESWVPVGVWRHAGSNPLTSVCTDLSVSCRSILSSAKIMLEHWKYCVGVPCRYDVRMFMFREHQEPKTIVWAYRRQWKTNSGGRLLFHEIIARINEIIVLCSCLAASYCKAVAFLWLRF